MNQTLANWSKPVSLNSSQTHRNRASFTRWPFIITYCFPFTHLLFHFVIPMSQIVQSIFLQSSTSCKALVLVSYTSAAAIFSSLTSIAWNRHRNVLRPFIASHPKKLKTYVLLDASIWCYAFITSLPFFFYSFKSPSGVICSTKKTVVLKVVEIIATAR